MTCIHRGEIAADRLAESDRVPLAVLCGGIEYLAGLACRAKITASQRRIHILTRKSHKRDLGVVHQHRSVCGNGGYKSAPHQIYENRRHSRLDHMPAEAPNYRFVQITGPPDLFGDPAERFYSK